MVKKLNAKKMYDNKSLLTNCDCFKLILNKLKKKIIIIMSTKKKYTC